MPLRILIGPDSPDADGAAIEALASALRHRDDVTAVERRGTRLIVTATLATPETLIAGLPRGFIGELETRFDPTAPERRHGGPN